MQELPRFNRQDGKQTIQNEFDNLDSETEDDDEENSESEDDEHNCILKNDERFNDDDEESNNSENSIRRYHSDGVRTHCLR